MSVAGYKDEDHRYMSMALALGRRGLGTTMPNPAVGAVIVQGAGEHAEVIGRGWTQPGGRPHAETEALGRAGERARGATLYVTLEPCSHHGRTSPCAEAIIKAGIRRVVIAIRDPDERVAGQGIALLEAAGIAVVEGIGREEARWLTLGHIRRVMSGRPFVQVKLAVSANDVVSHGEAGAPVWVTGEAARAQVHLMRAKADALLTGIGTVLADDPELTCRLPGLFDHSPVRVVLDRSLRLPLTGRLVDTAREVPLWVICGPGADGERVKALEKEGVRVFPVKENYDRAMQAQILDWGQVLSVLAEEGVTRLMVEAGPRIARSLACETMLVDDYVLFRGCKVLDGARGTLLEKIWPAERLERMARVETGLPGGETMISYRPMARDDLQAQE